MFICFEGIAGSGKTTQTRLLSDYLKNSKKLKVFDDAVFEGNQRNIVSSFMNQIGFGSDANAVMFLFQALHSVHFSRTLKELSRNDVVIADRWRHSFISYHQYHKTFGDEINLIYQLDKLAYRNLEPDFYILIELPVELAFQRYIEREKLIDDNSLQISDIDTFRAINYYYHQLFKNDNWHIIDGTQSINSVFFEIKTIVDKIL